MPKCLVFIFLLLASQAFPQTVFELDQSKSISVSGRQVPIPFSQGINSAQIQTIDLTGDGVEEWVIWDINSRQLQIFEKRGEDFLIRPELSYYFPTDISGFLVLADFDNDGKKDLFTSTPLGIRAYRNTSTATTISWALAQNFLRLEGANNIPANNLDTPLIQDLDGDGDLDLVIFNFAMGDYLEFYKNTSVERKGAPDVDGFAFSVRHWGNFEFCGCGEFSWGLTCDGRPLDDGGRIDENAKVLHAGGHSILYRDFTGDGVPDLLLGRDECNTLYFLPNIGDSSNPRFTAFSSELPGYAVLPAFPKFHIGQIIGEDLVISLNSNEAAAPYKIDFGRSVIRLDNTSGTVSPVLQDQLFDLGENTRPFFKGNMFSGELWLTANGKSDDSVLGLAYRLNYSEDRFDLVDSDYLNLSALNLIDLQLFEYTSVKNQTFLFSSGVKTTNGFPSQVLFRKEGANWEDFSLSGLNLRNGDHLNFFSYQAKDYLLVAAQNGSLSLYEISFESQSVDLKASRFLGFEDNPANRNLSIAVHLKDRPDLYAADQTGRIFLVKDFMNSDVREEVLVKIDEQNQSLRLGRNTWVSVLHPSFGKEPDLILGGRGGGIIYLKATGQESPSGAKFDTKVYPNPSSGPIKILVNQPATAQLVSPLGQVIFEQANIPAHREVTLQAQIYAPGLYLLRLTNEKREVLVKKILIR
jgi:hypothetical protein